ncbi:hypothetical protein ACFVTX_04970 [Agromyces sp. NPDC058136]|uniref:hypothetical protein n=1 Tax=Agromyces sp. NPDC058136 TaxID=3346354 RepID=UPI0036DE1047
MSYADIYELLGGVEDFELRVNNRTVVVRRVAPEQWLVYLDEDLIGSFVQRNQDRATFFESEIASEPGTVNWVSDDVTGLISRMITLA